MRFTDIKLKIGVNLYSSEKEVVQENDRNYSVTTQKIVGSTLVFDGFVKKSSVSVKPEYQNVVSNPTQPRKEQISLEKFYDIEFEVLAQDMNQAIKNYNKLLKIIDHLYFLKTRVPSETNPDKIVPNRYGNVGVIFKGNPPIFKSYVNGFRGVEGVRNGYARNYEAVFVAESFIYNIDMDKGYILVPSRLINEKCVKSDKNDETLIPISFTITLNGTCVEDRFSAGNCTPFPLAPIAKPVQSAGSNTAQGLGVTPETNRSTVVGGFSSPTQGTVTTAQTTAESVNISGEGNSPEKKALAAAEGIINDWNVLKSFLINANSTNQIAIAAINSLGNSPVGTIQTLLKDSTKYGLAEKYLDKRTQIDTILRNAAQSSLSTTSTGNTNTDNQKIRRSLANTPHNLYALRLEESPVQFEVSEADEIIYYATEQEQKIILTLIDKVQNDNNYDLF